MQSIMNIAIILGTAHEGRVTEAVARFTESVVTKLGHTATFIDVKDYLFGKTIPGWTPHEGAQAYRNLITKANALIVVTPEYNHSFPGELKLLIDAAYTEYVGIPVGFVGVGGVLGGGRAIEQLRQVVIELGALPAKQAVYCMGASTLVGADGVLRDHEQYASAITKLVTELVEKQRP